MYLGNKQFSVNAKDNGTIYAQAATPPKLEVKAEPLPVAQHQTVASPEPKSDALELARLRTANAIYRSRIRGLLDVIRGHKKLISRQEKELAALREPERLTVDEILAQGARKAEHADA